MEGDGVLKSTFLAVPLPAHTPCPVPPPNVTMKWGHEGSLGRGKDVTKGAAWCVVYVRRRKLGLSPTGCCDHRRWTQRGFHGWLLRLCSFRPSPGRAPCLSCPFAISLSHHPSQPLPITVRPSQARGTRSTLSIQLWFLLESV